MKNEMKVKVKFKMPMEAPMAMNNGNDKEMHKHEEKMAKIVKKAATAGKRLGTAKKGSNSMLGKNHK